MADVLVVVGSQARVAAAQGARVLVQPRPGYGAACWEGAREAAALGGEVVVFLDGDYSNPPLELASVLAPVVTVGANLVLAVPRVLLGRWELSDLPSFKAIRVHVLEALQMREMTYGWTVEMVVKAARASLRIGQVSINYRPRLAGRSKVSGTVLGTLRAAWTLLMCAARYARWTPQHDSRGGMKPADDVAYVVAKVPRAGITKTRLCPPLSPDQAAQLASAFLLDTVATVNLAGVTARIVCREMSEQQPLRRLVGPLVPVSVQSGNGLGDALEGAFREGLADGVRAVAVLGADSPTLPALVLREAFVALGHGFDVVLGPAEDGGYYLLAARAVHPWLFREMSWSTDGVASETLRRCRTLGLRTHVLPTWYDVDDAASLDVLRTDLGLLPMSTAAHTRAVLHALDNSTLPIGYAA